MQGFSENLKQQVEITFENDDDSADDISRDLLPSEFP